MLCCVGACVMECWAFRGEARLPGAQWMLNSTALGTHTQPAKIQALAETWQIL